MEEKAQSAASQADRECSFNRSSFHTAFQRDSTTFTAWGMQDMVKYAGRPLFIQGKGSLFFQFGWHQIDIKLSI